MWGPQCQKQLQATRCKTEGSLGYCSIPFEKCTAVAEGMFLFENAMLCKIERAFFSFGTCLESIKKGSSLQNICKIP